MHPLKRIADGLTWLRAALALVILVLAVTRGYAALEHSLILLVVAWITDSLDGALARGSGQMGTTWIGRHDPLVDIGLGVAVWILLASAKLIHPLVAVLHLLIWGGIFWHQRGYRVPQPALFAGVTYGWTIIHALQHYPYLGWALILYLLTVFVAEWNRMWNVRVPRFLKGLGELVDLWSGPHS